MTSPSSARILAAPDKFRGTATAPEVCDAIARGAAAARADCRALPLADGGEGTLDAFGGPNRTTTVTGPLGTPVTAAWRLDAPPDSGDRPRRAVVEMAQASGLALAGGAARNDPIAATTRGTGELIAAAAAAGARHILVGVGGSATTDGGAGALAVLAPAGRRTLPESARITVCADVRTRFLDAATVFGPQKGADPEQVAALTERLHRLRDEYVERFGVDVSALDRSGAAGGLAGGLAAIGAYLLDGFDAVAGAVGLDDAIAQAGLVVTGEGRLDASSLQGKVVGGVIGRAAAADVPVLVVCGSAAPDVRVPPGVTVIPLVEVYGTEAAMTRVGWCVADAVARHLAAVAAHGGGAP